MFSRFIDWLQQGGFPWRLEEPEEEAWICEGCGQEVGLTIACPTCVPTIGCWECGREEGLKPDHTLSYEAQQRQMPQRKVVTSWVGGGPDPTEVYRLECGHVTI